MLPLRPAAGGASMIPREEGHRTARKRSDVACSVGVVVFRVHNTINCMHKGFPRFCPPRSRSPERRSSVGLAFRPVVHALVDCMGSADRSLKPSAQSSTDS